MNAIPGHIRSIQTEGHLSIVQVEAIGTTFTSIIIDTPETLDYLQPGNAVKVLFKENEVSIGKGLQGMISMRNRLVCTIQQIEAGKLLAKLELDHNGTRITSIITTGSVQRMGLAVGMEVEALIKTNEITLSPDV